MEAVADQTAFVVLYSGKTIGESKIVAVSAEKEIVSRFTDMLPEGTLEKAQRQPDLRLVPGPDDAA